MLILVIIAYIFLSIYELIPLYKQRLRNDFFVNLILEIISFTFVILLCFKVVIPSPEKPIRELITSIFGK